MTGIEKVIIGVFVGATILMVISVQRCSQAIEEAGGIRQIIIDTGKDVREIKKEINEK